MSNVVNDALFTLLPTCISVSPTGDKPWHLWRGKFAAIYIQPSTWGNQQGELLQCHEMDNSLKESDVRASSRTVRASSRTVRAPSWTSGHLTVSSEQVWPRRPEELKSTSDRPEATPNRPDQRRTVRAAPRTVRINTTRRPPTSFRVRPCFRYSLVQRFSPKHSS